MNNFVNIDDLTAEIGRMTPYHYLKEGNQQRPLLDRFTVLATLKYAKRIESKDEQIKAEWTKHFKEFRDYLATVRDETAMGKVYLGEGESEETKQFAVDSQTETIESVLGCLNNAIKQADKFIAELSTPEG